MHHRTYGWAYIILRARGIVIISLKAVRLFFVCDRRPGLAVKGRKNNLLCGGEGTQQHFFWYGLYVFKTTFLNRIPVLENVL